MRKNTIGTSVPTTAKISDSLQSTVFNSIRKDTGGAGTQAGPRL
jgi:hypothetical protein